jgi:DNA invertase Pin-like site-specific DNA recombinase
VTKRSANTRTREASAQEVRRRAATYLRMSTESQRYSIGNQTRAIQEYADLNQIDIVKIYKDEGKSGLTIEGRKALGALIGDIIAGRNDFSEILVFDISRWGRFQDPDESGHYEFLCRHSGVRVTYCEDLYVNDGTPYSAVAKFIKRAQAADDSRIKSARVFATLCHLAENGFHTGGVAPYGFVRVAVDKNRLRKQPLAPGTQRSIRADNVILMRGKKAEIRVVRRIFELYVNGNVLAAEIARRLNASGIASPTGRLWSHSSVTYIITNRLYTGVKDWNRVSAKLKTKRHHNDLSTWIVSRILRKGIIAPALFEKAQRVRAIRRRRGRKGNEQLLAELKKVVANKGPVPGTRMGSWCGLSSQTTYIKRFGSLRRAYDLIDTARPKSMMQWARGLGKRQARAQILNSIRLAVKEDGGTIEFLDLAHTFCVDGRLRGYLDLLTQKQDSKKRPCWRLRMPLGEKCDVYVVGLLNDRSLEPSRYYVIPRELTGKWSILFREGPVLHGRRLRRLEAFRRAGLSDVIDDIRYRLASGLWRLKRPRRRLQSNRQVLVA